NEERCLFQCVRFYAADLRQRTLDHLPRIAIVERSEKLPILRAEKDVISGRGDGVAKYYFVRILLRQPFGERLPGFSIISAPIYTKLALACEALPVRIQRDDENRAVVTDRQ